jgi:hypothetical protein
VRQLAQSDEHDAPGLLDELVASLAAVDVEIVVTLKTRLSIQAKSAAAKPGSVACYGSDTDH